MSARGRRMVLALALAGSLLAARWVASQDEPAAPKARAETAQPDRTRMPDQHARGDKPAAPETLMLQKLQRSVEEAKPGALFDTESFTPAPAQTGRVEKTAPPPPPPPPPMPFRYIGRLREGGQTTVFLDAGERSFTARLGDVLDGQYKLDSIGETALVFTYVPSQQQQTLPIAD